jgi:hypothetical protein
MRWQFWMAAGAMAAGLVGCGGGGSADSGGSSNEAADGNLHVTYDYPAQTQQYRLFDTISVAPVIDGLGGSTAHFTVDTTIAPLPPGFTHSATTGAIGGHAGIAGSHHVSSVMTVDGYDGTLTRVVSFNITTDIRFSYPVASVVRGTPMQPLEPVITGLEPGDAVSGFRLLGPDRKGVGTLPPGLTMDPLTGVITGTATTAGVYTAFVDATVTRGGREATIQSQSYLYFAIN